MTSPTAKLMGKSNYAQTARPKTYHEGANDERSSILAKVRRMVKETPADVSAVYINGTELIAWLLKRNERYKKNPGGL